MQHKEKRMKENGMKKLLVMMLLAAVAGSASAALVTTTTFDGSGDLTSALNWDSGLPSNANPGLVSGGGGWMGPVWTDFAVRQTGGAIFAAGAGDLAMRGGAENSGNTTILEIDDASNTDFSTVNMTMSGILTMWAQNGGGHELSLLNGFADVGILSAVNSPTLSTINIGNGKLDIGSLAAAKVTVNMLSGGTGEVVLADQSGSLLNDLRLDFAADSSASFTILANGGATTGGYWDFYVGAGFASIGGITETDLSKFLIESDGGFGTTISVIPEPATLGLVAAFGGTILFIRRRFMI
jgi:hypothetical protein